MPRRTAKRTDQHIDAQIALDQVMMRRAIKLSLRSEGRVEPNPMVGCVIARGAKTLGEGHHRRYGGAHAEIEALNHCASDPRGATAYVTLEPCAHIGKTPPCVDALLTARLARVVIAVRDPNPQVNGKSIRRLRRAGVRVDVGLCAVDAADVLAPFLTRMRLRRPYVIAKWAQTLDGKLATRYEDSRWISGEASRRLVHRLRARVDAVIVGSNTVITDNPKLTARDVPRRRTATRVILDGRLRLPPYSRLVSTAATAETLVLTTSARAKSVDAKQLEKKGVTVVAVGTRNERLSPTLCLRALAKRDMTNVLLEGGPTLLGAFFRASVIDEAWVFTAPVLLGDEYAPQAISDKHPVLMSDAIRPRVLSVKNIDGDTLHRLRFNEPPRYT